MRPRAPNGAQGRLSGKALFTSAARLMPVDPMHHAPQEPQCALVRWRRRAQAVNQLL